MQHLLTNAARGPVPSPSSIRDYTKMKTAELMTGMHRMLARALVPVTIQREGVTYVIKTPGVMTGDKWTGLGGREFFVSAISHPSFLNTE